MSLCAAQTGQLSTDTRISSHFQRRRFSVHGKNLLVGWRQSFTHARACHYKRVLKARAFLQHGLEQSFPVSLDKSSQVIKQVGQDSYSERFSSKCTISKELEELSSQGSHGERSAIVCTITDLQRVKELKELEQLPPGGEEDTSAERHFSEFQEDLQKEEYIVNLPAARKIVELLTAWDTLSEKLKPELLRCNGSQLLLGALKIAIPAFHILPYSEDGRFQLCRALSVAYTLADLHMDAEVIAAGILRIAVDTKTVSLQDVQREVGNGMFHLLHDCMRVKQLSRRMDTFDDENAAIFREYTLAFHEVRAMVVEIATRLDEMRNIYSLPKHRQQAVALENMQLYAPLAHALGLSSLSQELEDTAFRVLFPDSYEYVGKWLQSHWGDGEVIISDSIKKLKEALEGDQELQGMVESVEITGRCKSRFSTMKKLLKDGRKPDEVYDILGLRVILFPKQEELGVQACYRAQKIATSLWKEVPGRTKDYIAKPKLNGYESLHLTIHLTNYGSWSLPMELQIRTSAMHSNAVCGDASHSFYKGGLTDPQQVQHFKAIMLAAAKAATTCSFEDESKDVDHVFRMFDKNKDGIISRKEFQDVFSELGVDKSDSSKLMKLIDTNTDGSVDAQELGELQRQVRNSRKYLLKDCIAQLRQNEELNKFETIQLPVF